MELYNKKQALKDLGVYTPAFLKMRLNFPFPKGNLPLYQLSAGDLSVFIHEYIHFLQDISSYCLINNAYYYSEYIHTALNYIYKIPGKYLEIPLRMPQNISNVDANEFINKTCFGSSEEIDTLFVIKVKLQEEPFPYKGVGLRCIEKRIIVTPNKEIHFGYLAVMESMAYIMESLISHPRSSPYDYPYMSAQLVVENIYPSFGKDILNILALCDVSLQYSNPGNVFVFMLEQMRAKGWLPNKPEDVYDYVYEQKTCVMGRDMPYYQALTDMSMTVEERIKLYIKDKRISPLFDWYVHNLLRYGLCLRLAKPYFILEIARGGYALYNRPLIEIMNRVGAPIIEDDQQTFHTMPPYGINSLNGVLEIFPAIEQIHNCLHEGATCCDMYELCDDSERQYNAGLLNEPSPIADDDCVNAPWKHCRDRRLCPYAVLWRHWGLEGKVPVLRKKNAIN